MFPDARTIRWTAPDDGVEIEGVLMTPRGADGPLPLIVCVHGGPTWNWGAFFSDSEPNAVLLASAGYACLLPNPRGSVGRGHAFAQGVIGDGGGIDYRDIMAGVDHCIAEGIADPERLGIAGLSYGGYMAGWAVGQTDRFGASVAMSVVSNYVSFHLTSEVWWYDQAILEGEWNDPTSQYVDRSPVTHAHRCTTPTLILQGAEDRCTPRGQGEELYRAIAEAGAETELVVYPREGHVPLERAHALDAIRRTQAWFDRHLLGRGLGAERCLEDRIASRRSSPMTRTHRDVWVRSLFACRSGPPMPKYLLAIKTRRFEFGRVTVSGSAQKLGAPPESSPMNDGVRCPSLEKDGQAGPGGERQPADQDEEPSGPIDLGTARNRSRSR